MKYLPIVFLGLLIVCTGATSAAVVGWNNDGSGDYGRDCKPPLSFDGDKATGVRWKAALPNWSNSSPIVIEPADGKGPVRVVCLAEPLDYAPVLLCFDADSGKELWRRELDPIPLLPAAQQEEARTMARRGWALIRTRKALTVEIQDLYKQDQAAWANKQIPASARAIMERVKTAGLEFLGFKMGAGGYPNYLSMPHNSPGDQDEKKLAELGLLWSKWDYDGTWDGVAYPTPLSDGQRILTVTAHNLYSCHDLDGQVLWQTRFPSPKASDFTPEQIKRVTGPDGKRRWNGGLDGSETSPLLVDGLMISNTAGMIRALDLKTGQSHWAVPAGGKLCQGMSVPAVATVGSERYVMGVNGDYMFGSDPILRLRDGVEVGSLPGTVMLNGPVMLKSDLVLNWAQLRHTVVAHRLVAADGRISGQEIWRLPRSEKRDQNIGLERSVWRDGKLYEGGSVLDGVTGTLVAARLPALNGGYYGGAGILAGGYYLSCDFYHGKFLWRDLTTGAKAGEGTLPVNPADGLSLALKREQACRNDWRWLGAATPFAWKDRLYVRAFDFLWCLSSTPKSGKDSP